MANGRIVPIGTLESRRNWIERRGARIDRTLENKILMPDFVVLEQDPRAVDPTP